MAKTERQMLREWASLLEADPYDFMGDIGRTSPHRGDPVMSPDLGGGVGPGGAGRSSGKTFAGKAKAAPTRIEPKLEPGAKPKIQIKPGETPAQAVQRAKKDLELKPEPAAAKPVPNARGKIEPSLKPIEKMKAGKRAPLPPANKSLGQTIKDIPHKKKAAAALGLGALWLMNKDQDPENKAGSTTTTVEPADNWGKPTPDYEDEKPETPGEVGGAGNEVPQGTARPSAPSQQLTPAARPSDTNTGGTGTSPGAAAGSGTGERGFDIDDREWGTRMTRENIEILTKHPVTGEVYRLKLQNPIMESQQSNLYKTYTCGTVRQTAQNSWRADAWSQIPISKLLKGIDK